MAGVGRPRKPTKLKVLEGTARKDRQAGNLALELPPGAPAEPNWERLLPGRSRVTIVRDAHEAWLAVVPDLDRIGLLASVDRHVLTAYCVTWARYLEVVRTISREGPQIKQKITRKDGSTYVQRIRHPLAVTENEYRAALDKYWTALGLDPLARERLNVPSSKAGTSDDDEASVFGG